MKTFNLEMKLKERKLLMTMKEDLLPLKEVKEIKKDNFEDSLMMLKEMFKIAKGNIKMKRKKLLMNMNLN